MLLFKRGVSKEPESIEIPEEEVFINGIKVEVPEDETDGETDADE